MKIILKIGEDCFCHGNSRDAAFERIRVQGISLFYVLFAVVSRKLLIFICYGCGGAGVPLGGFLIL